MRLFTTGSQQLIIYNLAYFDLVGFGNVFLKETIQKNFQ